MDAMLAAGDMNLKVVWGLMPVAGVILAFAAWSALLGASQWQRRRRYVRLEIHR
jgi:hypothetical protein